MSTRGITNELVEHVKSFEGWSARPYLCPSGHPTIGYGRRVESLQVPSITLEQGEQMLREDLLRFRDAALTCNKSYSGGHISWSSTYELLFITESPLLRENVCLFVCSGW